ncbi:MAG TPA: hypothetical protein ENI51_05430, partial [Candidatus Atribacteria bacterium]|nr:hypothetical protein [Candidatus Atribacteria bacterium]
MDYVGIGIGIGVSITLFIITYYKTIGAKKERVNQTYHEVVKILVRNLVNNDSIPSIPEINWILQAKSLENRIDTADLPDEIAFIYALYTKIAEDEILSPDKKNKLILEINKYIKKIEKETLSAVVREEIVVNKEEKNKFLLALVSMLIATLGVFATLPFSTEGITVDILVSISMALVGMAIMLFVVMFIIRLKEEQEETIHSRRAIFKEYKEFEKDVFKIIKSLGEVVTEPTLKKENQMVRFDILLKRKNKNFLIEIKMFRNYINKFIANNLEIQAKLAKTINKNNITVLVVNDKKYLYPYFDKLSNIWDHIFDIEDLKNFRIRTIYSAKG